MLEPGEKQNTESQKQKHSKTDYDNRIVEHNKQGKSYYKMISCLVNHY